MNAENRAADEAALYYRWADDLTFTIFFNFMLQWFHDIIIPNRQMGYHKLQFYDIVSGDFVLKEHEAAKWLTKENLDSVDWLPADQGLVEKIKEEL